MDYPYFKILASRGRTHGLDLSNASSNAGTAVTIWQYADSNTTPTHRQWMLFPLTSASETNGIEEVESGKRMTDDTLYDLQGRKVKTTATKGIYIVNGRKVVRK